MVEQVLLSSRRMAAWLRRSVLSRPFVRHVGALTVANGIVAVLSFVQGILVARWLGPELYGVAALVMSVPGVVHTFIDVRSSEALVKYLSEFHARGDKTRAAALCRLGYLIDFVVATAAFLGVLAIAPWASRAVVHRPELAWLLVIYAAAFLPRSLQGTSLAVLTVLRCFTTIALLQTIITGLRMALVLSLVLVGWSVFGVVVGNAIGVATGGVVAFIVGKSFIEHKWGSVAWRSAWEVLRGYRRHIFHFLAYNDLTALIGLVPKQLDIVMLGYFRGPTEAGLYKLAKSLASAVGLLVGPLQSVVYPELAHLWVTGQQQHFYSRVKRLAYLVGLPLGLIVLTTMSVVFPVLVPMIVGRSYQPAVTLAQVLLVGYSIWLAFFFLRPAYLSKGLIREWTKYIVMYSAIFIFISLLLVSTFGALGICLAQIATICITHVIAMLALCQEKH